MPRRAGGLGRARLLAIEPLGAQAEGGRRGSGGPGGGLGPGSREHEAEGGKPGPVCQRRSGRKRNRTDATSAHQRDVSWAHCRIINGGLCLVK